MVVHKELRHTAALAIWILRCIIPIRHPHDTPVYVVQIFELVEAMAQPHDGVAIIENEWQTCRGHSAGIRYKVKDLALPACVTLNLIVVDGIEHRGSWCKVKRRVIIERSSRRKWNQRNRATNLQTHMSYVDCGDSSCLLLAVAPYTPIGNDRRKVVNVGDMEDWW